MYCCCFEITDRVVHWFIIDFVGLRWEEAEKLKVLQRFWMRWDGSYFRIEVNYKTKLCEALCFSSLEFFSTFCSRIKPKSIHKSGSIKFIRSQGAPIRIKSIRKNKTRRKVFLLVDVFAIMVMCLCFSDRQMALKKSLGGGWQLL